MPDTHEGLTRSGSQSLPKTLTSDVQSELLAHSAPRKLLVFSHACVAPINQSFYADVRTLTGWSVDLVIPAGWNSEYRNRIEVSRWPSFHGRIYAIPVWKSGNIPLHVYRSALVRLLREASPDYIYVHHEPYGLATAQIYLANLLTGDCPIGFYAAQNIPKKYPFPFSWFERLVLRRSAFAFPVTEGALTVLRNKGYQGPAEVLPLALDKGMYYPRPDWSAGKRQELTIGSEEFVVGYLGRLVQEKGLGSLLLALQALGDKPWRCLLVGSGPMEAELRARVTALGLERKVIFVGFVDHEEVPGWLSLFDVLVLASESRPNWKEQFGRVIIEANACETPVIGTESGEIGRVLRDTGGGLVVPEGDVGALGRALVQLVDDPNLARQLSLSGAATVELRYDQVLLAKRFATAIQSRSSRKRRH